VTLDDFVVSPATAPAMGAVRACVAPESKVRCVLLLGPPGVGKTHLLRGAAAHVRATRPRETVEVLSASEVVDGLVGRGRGLGPPRHISLLAIDDLHVLAGRAMTQLEMARLLRQFLQAGSRIVLAGGRRARDVEELYGSLKGTARCVLVPPLNRADLGLVLAGVGVPKGTVRERACRAAQGDFRRALGRVRTVHFRDGLDAVLGAL
jgi:chromosomal replication initiation ATPase DnaA